MTKNRDLLGALALLAALIATASAEYQLARAFAEQTQRDAGKAPSLRELQAHFRIGQARAQRIRVQLAGGAA